MTVLLTLAACCVISRWMARFLGLALHFGEYLMVGLILLSCCNVLAAALSLLTPVIAVIPLFLAVVGGIVEFIISSRRRRTGFIHSINLPSREIRSESAASRFNLAAGASALALLLPACLLPPHGMDALTYHLALPDQYLIRKTWMIPGFGAYSHHFQQMEMALISVLALDRSGVSANIIVFSTFLSLISAVFLLARVHTSRESALVAASAVAVSPLCASLVLLTKNDLMSAGLVIWAAYRMGRHEKFAPLLSALYLAAAVAVKPTSLFAVVPLGLVLLYRLTLVRPSPWIRACLLLASLPLIWIVRNLYAADSLIPPVLSDPRALIHVDSNPAVGDSTSPSAIQIAQAAGTLTRLGESFVYPLRDATDGPYGTALFLLVSLAVFYGRDRSTRTLTLASAAGIAAWFVLGNDQPRFLLPIFCIAAVVGSAHIHRLSGLARPLTSLAITASLIIGLYMMASDYGLNKVLFGKIDAQDFVGQFLDSYAVQKEADRVLPPDAYVLAVGEAELFHLHRRADFAAYWEPEPALSLAHESHSARTLHAALREKGYTHILYNPVILQNLLRIGLKPPPGCERDIAVLEELMQKNEQVLLDPRRPISVFKLKPEI